MEGYNDMIVRVAEIAEQAFWTEVAMQFPEVVTGDLEPMTSIKFSAHCCRVISEWLATNQENIILEPISKNS